MCRKTLTMILMYITVLSLFAIAIVCSDRSITAIAENAPFTNRKCVVLDAGHGGEDGGAVSYSGISESMINLEITTRLNDLLHLLGIDTFMIRKDDISVYTSGSTLAEKKISDLRQRVKLINETENCILLSIHQNYYSDQKYSGAQVFYASTDGSDALAQSLQKNFSCNLDPTNNRKIKKAEGIYLMKRINCTGVLIECGFLSNPTEESMLKNPIYQKKLCCIIATTVSNYLDRS